MAEKKIHNTKKAILNAMFVIALLAFTFYYVFKGEDIEEISMYVRSADKFYLLMALGMVLIFVCSESVIIHYLMHNLNYKLPLKNCIRYSFIGFFISYITPSASGGQPAQMYFMKKDHVPLSASTLVLIIVTIAYKFVLLFIGFITLFFSFSFIMENIASVWGILLLGVILNIIVIGFLLLVIFKQSLAKRVIGMILIWLGRIGLVKNYKKRLVHFLQGMKKYEMGAAYMKTHKHLFFHVFLITLIQRIALFMVTYFVYRSFGLQGISAYKIVLLQTLIAIAVDNLPLPGGMGVTEGLYCVFFQKIFGSALVIPSLILSRGISFYAVLLIGGIITLWSYFMKPHPQTYDEFEE